MKTHIDKTSIAAIIAIQILLFGLRCECSEPSSSWGREILGTRVVPVNGPELDVWFIKEESGKSIGRCSLANVQSGGYQPVRLIIEGEWRERVFWPIVIRQVGNQAKGPWKTLGRESTKLKNERIVLEPGDSLADLRVSLEPFRKYIGKYQVGRIVVTSGDSAVFELKHLAPPERKHLEPPE